MDMRDLPGDAAGADREELNCDGGPSGRRAPGEVRPEPAGRGRKSEERQVRTLEQYKSAVYEHLTRELHFSAAVAAGLMKEYEPFFPEFFADDYSVAMAATYMAHNY